MATTCICSSPGCDKELDSSSNADSTKLLACPKCLEYNMTSYFCSQACFRTNYTAHKQVHVVAKQVYKAQQDQATAAVGAHRKTPPRTGVSCDSSEPRAVQLSLPDWANSYAFTGALRPALYSPQKQITEGAPQQPDYAKEPSGISYSEQRDRSNHNSIRVYTEKELKGRDDPTGLRHACAMGREVLDIAGKAVKVGVTTDEIDRIVHDACLERNVYPSPLNYYNFPKSVCTSVNEVICHGIPDYRELQDGDIVNLDVTTYNAGGYHGDLNETFFVGNVDDDGEKLVKTSFECLQTAMDLVKPGTLYRDLGTVIEKHARKNKCNVVRTYCGHGIGSLFHTNPNIPHYAKNKAKGVMKAGHVFTIEPMINLGVPSDKTWDDNWTAVTSDGKRSSQFEHTLIVTDGGFEILTARENEPKMIWNAKLNQR